MLSMNAYDLIESNISLVDSEFALGVLARTKKLIKNIYKIEMCSHTTEVHRYTYLLALAHSYKL